MVLPASLSQLNPSTPATHVGTCCDAMEPVQASDKHAAFMQTQDTVLTRHDTPYLIMPSIQAQAPSIVETLLILLLVLLFFRYRTCVQSVNHSGVSLCQAITQVHEHSVGQYYMRKRSSACMSTIILRVLKGPEFGTSQSIRTYIQNLSEKAIVSVTITPRIPKSRTYAVKHCSAKHQGLHGSRLCHKQSTAHNTQMS